jgi:hypothetical protein
VDWTLELMVVPVSDVDRAKAFYADKMNLANRMPTAASYLRRPGDSTFRPFKFDALRIEDALIVEITTFGAGLFPVFRLPPAL